MQYEICPKCGKPKKPKDYNKYPLKYDGGLLILVTKNFIRDKKIVRLDSDTIKLCEAAGFELIDRWYRKLTNFSFWIRNYFNKYGIRVEYEDILIFKKAE